MSLIADALRKIELPSSGAPPPQPPRNLWLYRSIMAGSIVAVLAALALISKRPAIPSTPDTQKTMAVSTPKGLGMNLLRAAQGGLHLDGIVQGGDGKALAIINNQIYEEGSTIRGLRIVRVDSNQVQVEQEGKERILKLPR